MYWLINLIVNAVAVIITAYLLPGVTVAGFVTALVVAIVLAVVNTFLRPLLLVLTLPVNVLTLGLFTFVVNAILILLVAALVPGFRVENFWWALLFSLVLAVVVYVLNLVLPGATSPAA
jgi:putative membrane protein